MVKISWDIDIWEINSCKKTYTWDTSNLGRNLQSWSTVYDTDSTQSHFILWAQIDISYPDTSVETTSLCHMMFPYLKILFSWCFNTWKHHPRDVSILKNTTLVMCSYLETSYLETSSSWCSHTWKHHPHDISILGNIILMMFLCFKTPSSWCFYT